MTTVATAVANTHRPGERISGSVLVRGGGEKSDIVAGAALGFQLAVRHVNRRGCCTLSANGYYVRGDRAEDDRHVQRLALTGRRPGSVEESTIAVHEPWNFDDEGLLGLTQPESVTPGVHNVDFHERCARIAVRLPAGARFSGGLTAVFAVGMFANPTTSIGTHDTRPD